MHTHSSSSGQAGNIRPVFALAVFGIFLLVGVGIPMCSKDKTPPASASSLAQVERAMQGTPNYSVLVADAKQDSQFWSNYGLQYGIEQNGTVGLTDWFGVSKEEYDKLAPKKGMTVLSYQDGQRNATDMPPGYQYVGDERYGQWERDSSGNSFWVFYGQYRLLSDLFGFGMGGRMYRNEWDGYRRTGSAPPPPPPGRAAERDNFYSKRMKQEAKTNTAFASRVNQRVGRTSASAGARSRGSSSGK